MKKKNIVFIKKQKKKYLGKKKKILFKLNKQLEYLKILKILNKSTILIFFQFISLNSEKDEVLFKQFVDKNIWHIYWLKKDLKKILSKKWYYLLRNFNNMLSIQKLEDLYYLNKVSQEKNILILGYYLNNIFFYKKDFFLSNINIKKIGPIIQKVKIKIKKIYIKIIFLYKNILKKLLRILLKKNKNGNN